MSNVSQFTIRFGKKEKPMDVDPSVVNSIVKKDYWHPADKFDKKTIDFKLI